MGMGFLQTFPNDICFSESFSKRVPTLFGSKKGINTKHYDVVVIGSDEVFNCTQKTWFGFFVSIIWERTECKSDHYVCSILWCDYYRQITTCRQKEIVSSLLHDLDAISVRDENSMKVIEELTGRTPWLHVDPVLIFDYNQFIPINSIGMNI